MASDEQNATLYCPVCSTRLESRKCKLFCSLCGYYLSCAWIIIERMARHTEAVAKVPAASQPSTMQCGALLRNWRLSYLPPESGPSATPAASGRHELWVGMRFRQIISEDRPTLIPFDQDAWAAGMGYEGADPSESLAVFRSMREDNAKLLGASCSPRHSTGSAYIPNAHEDFVEWVELFGGQRFHARRSDPADRGSVKPPSNVGIPGIPVQCHLADWKTEAFASSAPVNSIPTRRKLLARPRAAAITHAKTGASKAQADGPGRSRRANCGAPSWRPRDRPLHWPGAERACWGDHLEFTAEAGSGDFTSCRRMCHTRK